MAGLCWSQCISLIEWERGSSAPFQGRKVGVGVGGDAGTDTKDVELEGRLGRNSGGESQMASVLREWRADKVRRWLLMLLGKGKASPQHHVPVRRQMGRRTGGTSLASSHKGPAG